MEGRGREEGERGRREEKGKIKRGKEGEQKKAAQ